MSRIDHSTIIQFLIQKFLSTFILTKFRTMKKIYVLILSVAFFSHASGQSISSQRKLVPDPDSYVDTNGDGNYNEQDGDYLISEDVTNQTGPNSLIIFFDYRILWVFNDVGNMIRKHKTGTEINSAGSKEVPLKMAKLSVHN